VLWIVLSGPFRAKLQCVEAEGAGTFLKFNHFESGIFKACAKGIRTNRDKRVTQMEHPHEYGLQAVASDEGSSRFENPPHFAKEFVLQCR
jgi:hypothetical protein